jgi:8-oxo-dGTP diphosphatase
MPYQPILGTLGYVLSADRKSALMVHRNARANDEHLGKYNGLGGKLEAMEDIAEGMRRELREEAHIEATSMRLRGTVNWPGFGKNGEDWLGFIFLIEQFDGTVPPDNVEGELSFIPIETILAACSDDQAIRDGANLPMWEGDRYFLPLVFNDDRRQFHGVMPYKNGRPVDWRWQWLDV